MVKNILILIFVILIVNVSALNNTETCSLVYDFILDHYDPINEELEFTDDDFDILQMQTTRLPNDLKNYIQYYDDLCEQELPFINYNNEWPEEEKEVEVKEQTVKQGFDKFLDILKQDYLKILIGILLIGLVIWIIGKI